ncbi:hypothetical protein [Halanaerobaculum tunisiense]
MKLIYSLLITILLVTVIINPVFAAQKYGAKAHGMGGAFTAVVDDASAIYWNPASLTQTNLTGAQASLGGQVDDDISKVADFIDKVKDTEELTPQDLKEIELPSDAKADLGGMVNFNLSKLAIGGIVNNKFNFSGQNKTVSGSDHEVEVPVGTATNTLVGQGVLGYGTELIDPPIIGALSVGATGKLVTVRRDEATTTLDDDDELVSNYDKEEEKGVGADIGILATLTDTDIVNLKAGATTKNVVNTIDMSSKFLDRTTTLGVGANFKFPVIEAFSAKAAADLEIPETGDNIKHFGVEGTIGSFSLRLGTYQQGSQDSVYTGGIGFNLPFVDFNLAADSEDYVKLSGTFNF